MLAAFKEIWLVDARSPREGLRPTTQIENKYQQSEHQPDLNRWLSTKKAKPIFPRGPSMPTWTCTTYQMYCPTCPYPPSLTRKMLNFVFKKVWIPTLKLSFYYPNSLIQICQREIIMCMQFNRIGSSQVQRYLPWGTCTCLNWSAHRLANHLCVREQCLSAITDSFCLCRNLFCPSLFIRLTLTTAPVEAAPLYCHL